MKIIRPTPLYEKVYDYLKESILSGRFEANKRINEANLAKKLKISRGPIREAIRMIESEGLIVRDERNNLHVYEATVEDMTNIYQCRRVLESLAAGLSAKRHTLICRNTMINILDEMEELIKDKEISEDDLILKFTSLSCDFHNTIILSSGNPRIREQNEQLKNLSSIYRKKASKEDELRKFVFEEHRDILHAIISRDVDLAERLMGEHIDNDLARLIKIYNSSND